MKPDECSTHAQALHFCHAKDEKLAACQTWVYYTRIFSACLTFLSNLLHNARGQILMRQTNHTIARLLSMPCKYVFNKDCEGMTHASQGEGINKIGYSVTKLWMVKVTGQICCRTRYTYICTVRPKKKWAILKISSWLYRVDIYKFSAQIFERNSVVISIFKKYFS